jgi:hypothetical protein
MAKGPSTRRIAVRCAPVRHRPRFSKDRREERAELWVQAPPLSVSRLGVASSSKALAKLWYCYAINEGPLTSAPSPKPSQLGQMHCHLRKALRQSSDRLGTGRVRYWYATGAQSARTSTVPDDSVGYLPVVRRLGRDFVAIQARECAGMSREASRMLASLRMELAQSRE